MKKLESIQGAKREIDSYEKHFTGAPLLIGVDDTDYYKELLCALTDDSSKHIIRMSDSCNTDFPPDPLFQISLVCEAARIKPVIWIGAMQSKMLYGQQETEEFIVNILGSSFNGPVIILCPYCCGLLESVGQRFVKLGHNIAVVHCNNRDIPRINLYTENATYIRKNAFNGIKAMLRALEDGQYSSSISLITSCDLSNLATSMYPVSKGQSPYQILCQIDSGIAAKTVESNGTEAQWRELANDLQSFKSIAELCEEKLCSVKSLQTEFGDFLSFDKNMRFLCYVCLKVFYGGVNDYLSYCLSKAKSVDELEVSIYESILDISHSEPHFISWIRQRRRILATLEENNALMKSFCELATIKGKDILWYISDDTEVERAAIIHALCSYSFAVDELNRLLGFTSPLLAEYIKLFRFDEYNTKVLDSDAYVRDLLTDYFQRYKIQKLTNCQDEDFVKIVESEAKERSFTKLQARSAIVKKLEKKDSCPYFFDALGVEYLAFIRSRAESYGMRFECSVGRCNLPSITSKNKEFYESFPAGAILKEERLDTIKHCGTKYDFQLTTEPLHIFDELLVLDGDLKKMSSALAVDRFKRIIILSDHGASRLAVTYRSENERIALAEPGRHSGRCCEVDNDPGLEYATFEDGFAVLANYERFKGSRKADVETHGGASLEEAVVPVITLTLKPKKQQLFFVETQIQCSPKDGSSILLFANPPLKEPRLVVNGQNYEGKLDGDNHNVLFEMSDIRRKGHYEADVYDAGVKIATLPFETKRQTATNQLI